MLAVVDECQNLRDRGVGACQRLHRAQPFGKNARSVEQFLVERTHRGQPLARELATLHADDIEAFETGVLTVNEAEWNHITANPADSADHHLGSYPGELMHRGQPADENKIADFAMTAKRCRSREDHVVADLAIVTDMATIHEIAAVADTGDAASGHGPGVHGHRFPDDAALTDLKPRQFAAIAQGLWRGAQRDEGVDRGAVADGGLRSDVDMRDQLAVRPDNDVAADDTIGTDRRALANHGAIFNPRGWIDRAHRGFLIA